MKNFFRAVAVAFALYCIYCIYEGATLEETKVTFCGKVTHQNATSNKYGSPYYWLEITDPNTEEVRSFSVTGSLMAKAELGETQCLSTWNRDAIMNARLRALVAGIVAVVLALFAF